MTMGGSRRLPGWGSDRQPKVARCPYCGALASYKRGQDYRYQCPNCGKRFSKKEAEEADEA